MPEMLNVRLNWILSVAACALFGLSGSAASAACGDKITVAGGGQVSMPAVISWDANLAQAKQVAQIKRKPFGIFFASKSDNPIIGEPIEAVQEYMKANNNTLPNSLTEVPVVIERARELGVGNFVKVPMTKANNEFVQSFGGEANLLIICTPAGEKITSIKCTADAYKNMEPVRKEIAAWQARNPTVK